MKIALLGGGFAGLTAAYYLSQKNHHIALFEKETCLGGLASGFKKKEWDWSLEKAVHHLFSNDSDILGLAKETGFERIVFHSPLSSSLYKVGDNYRTFPIDTPQDFLKFPLLPLSTKLRAAMVVAFLKFSPFLPVYERYTTEEFLRKTMGNTMWNVFWKELLRKKFGKYAGNVLASFIWARITKRTKNLGYVEGGFQAFIDHLEKVNKERGVEIRKGVEVEKIEKKDLRFTLRFGGLKINDEIFDAVISTLPTPVLVRIGESLFPQDYLARLKKIEYMHAISVVLSSDKPFLEKDYWINVCDPENPIMGIFQHTNFVDKKHYGGKHILYAGNYIESGDWRIKASEKEIIEFYVKNLKKINPTFTPDALPFVFKGPFAQPVFDKNFLKNKPDFETPIKNFFVANLDMTYPYDRGTNYAVKLGREVACKIEKM